jgi:hypothetical protein
MSELEGFEKHCEPAWLQGSVRRDERTGRIDQVMQDRRAC